MFDYKKILGISLISTIALGSGYAFLEPMFAGAVADDVTVTLTVDSEITIDSPNDVTVSPNLSLSNNTANGEVAWTVVTNDVNGYTLSVKGNQDPLMQSAGANISDYSETSAGTPEEWSVSNAVEFGFSAYGDDVPDVTWGTDQSSCGTDGPLVSEDRLYQGFDGTTEIQIASANSTTTFSGTSSTVCFAAEQESVLAASGVYSGTVTATALVQ